MANTTSSYPSPPPSVVGTSVSSNISTKYHHVRPDLTSATLAASQLPAQKIPNSPPNSPQESPQQKPGVRWSDRQQPSFSNRRSDSQARLSVVDMKWGVLFEADGRGTTRLEQILRGLAKYIVSQPSDDFNVPRLPNSRSRRCLLALSLLPLQRYPDSMRSIAWFLRLTHFKVRYHGSIA